MYCARDYEILLVAVSILVSKRRGCELISKKNRLLWGQELHKQNKTVVTEVIFNFLYLNALLKESQKYLRL